MKSFFLFCLCICMGPTLAPRAAMAQNLAAPDGVLSSYVNSELPPWLRLGGEERVRVETLDGVGFLPAENTYLLQRLRLNLDITPLTWLKFSFQAEDSRVFFTNVSPAPSSQRDPMDLRLGYVQIGNPEAGPVSLQAGRQSFNFGEGRLVSDPNWSNVGRSFDGAVLTLRYHNIRVDTFGGASDKIYEDGLDTPTPGEHFYGAYGSIAKWIPGATIEPYVFWKLEHNVKGELVKSGDLNEKTVGVRWVGKLPFGFDYATEMAIQRGLQVTDTISAWAGHWVLGHTLADTRHLPRFFAELNRASGDQNAHDGVHGAFDPLFAASHDRYGTTDMFCWTNIIHVRGGFQYRLRENLTVSTAYNSFWLANAHDGIYSSGKLWIASNGKDGTHIGQEPDVQAQWKVLQQTVVDLTFGHIFPGQFLQDTHHGSGYNCVTLGMTQRF